MDFDIIRYNRAAWDQEVLVGNGATIPVSSEAIANAKTTRRVILYAGGTKPLPTKWFENITGKDTLCLASGGGQQAPLFAAAGANVTVLDNSPLQLQQDKTVAESCHLSIRTVLGDMSDLTIFENGIFDLIYNPISNHFVEDVACVWRECHRVLRKGGCLISTFWNPVNYLFDYDVWECDRIIKPTYSIPYSDLTSLPKERLAQYILDGNPLEFGHSLQQQIGGQLDAGFAIVGYLEDRFADDPLSQYMDTVITTRAVKYPDI